VPGRRGGAHFVGVVTQHKASYASIQITSAGADLQSLLGHEIRLSLPAKLPVYSKGRYATHAVLHVGDAVIGILFRSTSGHWKARQLDDLGG
jgi:hypothetical protein